MVYYNVDEPSSLKNVLRVVIFLSTIYIAIREICEFLFAPCNYLKKLPNYLEWTLLVLIMFILFDLCPEQYHPNIAAASILLITFEIFHLAELVPFYSIFTHYAMLKTVILSFFKSFVLYAIILLAFSLSIFTLLHHEQLKGKEENNNDGGYPHFVLSILKNVFIIAIGDFNVDNLNPETNPFPFIVFLAFAYIVPIVPLNLLNGLAVSDIQAIKSDAEWTHFMRCAKLLNKYERSFKR